VINRFDSNTRKYQSAALAREDRVIAGYFTERRILTHPCRKTFPRSRGASQGRPCHDGMNYLAKDDVLEYRLQPASGGEGVSWFQSVGKEVNCNLIVVVAGRLKPVLQQSLAHASGWKKRVISPFSSPSQELFSHSQRCTNRVTSSRVLGGLLRFSVLA
jgi:hypothetical protein